MRGGLTLLVSAAALLAVGSGGAVWAAAVDYDVVIRNGRVLDGLGNPWVYADVAIKNGRLVKIGRVPGRGAREIDAEGDYVSPGWIDMMDQSGDVLKVNGLAENKLREGVTSAIAGEGGAPVPSAQLAAYFTQLQHQGVSMNFGTYYGATQAREEVMGDVAGAPTPEQMARMKAHVDEAMRAGAMGIATALIYPPASFQTTDELVELSKVAAKYDGIYASHMRDESADLLKAIKESIDIGERAGIQVEIFHFKAAWAPGWGKLVPEAGAMIDAARSQGVSIAADISTMTLRLCPVPESVSSLKVTSAMKSSNATFPPTSVRIGILCGSHFTSDLRAATFSPFVICSTEPVWTMYFSSSRSFSSTIRISALRFSMMFSPFSFTTPERPRASRCPRYAS